MTSEFKSILSIAVYHSYYEDQVCKDLVFEPSEETSRILNHFGFAFRCYENGFQLLAPSKDIKKLATYITRITKRKSFEFNAFVTSSNFRLFTQFPIDKLGYNLYKTSSGLKTSFQNATLLEPQFIESNTSQNALTIEVGFEDLQVQESRYSIQLNARRTKWEYYVINQGSKRLEDLRIKDKSSSPITFVNKGMTTLENGVSATLFSSEENELQVTNYPEYKFDLVQVKPVKNSKAKTITVFDGLPIPRPENIKIQLEDAQPVTSLMYIYV